MIVDARSLPPNESLRADICIVGGGAAGIAVALSLIDDAVRVVLLESGGTTSNEECRDLNQGVTVGEPYFSLDSCRARYLGGSTNIWGGWCRPLDALDFETRDGMPYSGWPFGKRHLDPYYRRAQSACRLGPYDYDAQRWRSPTEQSVVQCPSEVLADTVFQIRPLRFGAEYRPVLNKAANISLLLHANAVEIEMDGRTATAVRGATLAGNRFSVAATVFVLAAGGIENPRILLASRRTCRRGLGNEHDLVGRFFTEHLHVPAGIVRLNGSRLSFYAAHRVRDTMIRGGLRLTDHVRRREHLYGCGLSLHNADDPHDVLRPTEQPASYQSLRLLMRSVHERQPLERAWHHIGVVLADPKTAVALSYQRIVTPPARTLIIGCRAEQAPDPCNRVELGEDTDRLGVPRARVHWDIKANDRMEIRRAQRTWLAEFARAGLHVDSFDDMDEVQPFHTVVAAAHHIGTTRMHQDPKMGVVDEHCRVHGTANVYVAGSSVFPTAGWAPPTLTIVALAFRLGDHLKAVFGP